MRDTASIRGPYDRNGCVIRIPVSHGLSFVTGCGALPGGRRSSRERGSVDRRNPLIRVGAHSVLDTDVLVEEFSLILGPLGGRGR